MMGIPASDRYSVSGGAASEERSAIGKDSIVRFLWRVKQILSITEACLAVAFRGKRESGWNGTN